MSKPKVIVRTKYKLSLNNIDRNKIYNNADIKYVDGIIKYFSDDKKRIMSMLDYFTGKINKHEDCNLILEDGHYAIKEEIAKRQKYINKQFNNSNVWQVVLSFDKKFIDENISWRTLEKKLATEIIPKMLRKMNFVDIKNMKYEFSLHTNTKNPHFHISFMEAKPNTYDQNKRLIYRRKGKIPNDVIKYLKNETILTIEREKEFRPLVIELNKDIDELKQYFNPKDKNYILYDKKNILLEEKILILGKLLEEKEISYNNRIKFNSIKDIEIKRLTKEIKEEVFKVNKEVQLPLSYYNNSVKKINEYFIKLCTDNHINKKDIDLSYTKNKDIYLNNYILNAIVNHARYNYSKNKNMINKDDIFQSIVLMNYRRNKGMSKKDIVRNCLANVGNNRYKNKQEIRNAIKNINNEMEAAAEEFFMINKKDKSKEQI